MKTSTNLFRGNILGNMLRKIETFETIENSETIANFEIIIEH